MTFAITGVSGHTGKVAAETLLARGKDVRVIVRDSAKGAPWKARGAEVTVADLAEPASLAGALRGAAGAYLLVPYDPSAPSYRESQDRFSRAMSKAVSDSGVPHVVLLSSMAAQYESGTGPIVGLHLTERLLGEIRGTTVSSIRAGYFVENAAQSVKAAKETGVFPSFFPASFAFPMIGTPDIGRVAAELLVAQARKSEVVQLGTLHSGNDVATALSTIFGKTVHVQEAPLEAMVATLTGSGFSKDTAELYLEMTRAILAGKTAFESQHRQEPAREPLEQTLRALLA